MKRSRRSVVLLGSLVVVIACASATGARSQEAVGENGGSVRDGVYTEEQARRGRGLFAENCSYCHAPSQFSGGTFINRWSGSPVGSFFQLVRTTMPFDGPGRLSPQQYADVVAYVLEMNGFPAGETPLPPDREALQEIRIVAPEEGRTESP